MTTCSRCILNSNYPGLGFNEKGECSFCTKYQEFKPIGEDQLLKECGNAKTLARKRNIEFDVLLPLSGGKDSTYMLYLAAKKYGLRVLAMTYDNGLLSPLALKNINTTVARSGVQHVFHRPDQEALKSIYRTLIRHSGDICGACDIGTNASILKVSHDYKIPMIFSGVSPLENDSFVPDSIQDVARFRYIMKKFGNLSRGQLRQFLIYPHMNHFVQSYYKRTGYFGKLIMPLFYIDNPSDKEMGEIIKRELGWEDAKVSEYTKHFDCIAEPLTNYIRNHIYGYERRICQYSNMVRRGEISRDKAFQLFTDDNLMELPACTEKAREYLALDDQALAAVLRTEPLKFEKHTSIMNRLFAESLGLYRAFNSRLSHIRSN